MVSADENENGNVVMQQDGMEIAAAQLIQGREARMRQGKLDKDSIKQGDAHVINENRRGKGDLSVPVRIYI